MKNGCAECEKLSDDKLCPSCELEMLWAAVETALTQYGKAANKLLYPEKEVQNDN